VTAHLRALRLTRFRSYAEAELELDGRPVVLFGANGAGKTNLLEAVSLLAPGKGLRGAGVEEIAQRGSDGAGLGTWAVSADVAGGQGQDVRIGVGQDPASPSRKLVRLDASPATQADVARLIRIAWLTPAQDRVFAGPRGERLKFFDRLALALRPDHGANAARYEQAMRERARLLEEGRFDPSWLDGLEAEMAARGAAIAEARVHLLARLQAAIDARPEGAFPKADLALAPGERSDPTAWLESRLQSGEDAVAVEAEFRSNLRDSRRRDAAAGGRTLSGPHRTDFQAAHRAKAMPAGACSTGEQKALLVGLALAHARALAAGRGGAPPLLLLDEAAAHLDADRRAALVEELLDLGAQAWLTGTDRELFAAFGDRAEMFAVTEGRTERI
jgi:DNA replication and repair protein RecF